MRYDQHPKFPEFDSPKFWKHIAQQTHVTYHHEQHTTESWEAWEASQLRIGSPQGSPPSRQARESLFVLILFVVFLLLVVVVCFPFLRTQPPATAAAQQQTHTAQLSQQRVPPPAKVLARIDQWDARQYDSWQQANIWGPSACSAAAMTEVINYYSTTQYRIADILRVEVQLGEITPQLGMLHGLSSISRTVAQFGMQAQAVQAPTLDTIIRLANSGTPIIVGWPPATWTGGHILLVRGGNATTVLLVDSSRLNMTSMSRQAFLHYWQGFAVVVMPMKSAIVTERGDNA